MEDAVGVDGDDELGGREVEGITDSARLAAVHMIATATDANVGEVALGLEHPLEAVVYRAIVLRDHFKELVWIVAPADTLDRSIDGFAFIVAGKQDADGGLPCVILLDPCAGKGQLEYQPHEVLDH